MKLKIENTHILKGDVLGVDLGMQTTGIARAHVSARIGEPLMPLKAGSDLAQHLKNLINAYEACAVAVGLPRGLDSQDTDQTRWSNTIIEELRTKLPVPVYAIDEAGTTQAAEKRAHPGQDIDSVAAAIIVEDFLNEVVLGRIDHVGI